MDLWMECLQCLGKQELAGHSRNLHYQRCKSFSTRCIPGIGLSSTPVDAGSASLQVGQVRICYAFEHAEWPVSPLASEVWNCVCSSFVRIPCWLIPLTATHAGLGKKGHSGFNVRGFETTDRCTHGSSGNAAAGSMLTNLAWMPRYSAM